MNTTFRPTHRRPARTLMRVALTLSFGLVLFGCATTSSQVKTEVATLNAAMVACPMERADVDEVGNCWEEPVRQVDAFIDSHPDQPATTNPLRLRQALLLTVHRQDQLAGVAFSQVDSTQLQTDRDKAVYALRADLTWWYVRAPNVSPLTPDEIQRARTAVVNVDVQLATLDGPENDEMRRFLETTRVSMMLRIVNDTSTTADTRAQITEEMVTALERYADLLDDADRRWLLDDPVPGEEPPPAVLRRRVDAREIIRTYGRVAEDKELEPDWRPAWIQGLMG